LLKSIVVINKVLIFVKQNNLKTEIMEVGQKLNYFGSVCTVVQFDKTHVVIQFENGTKLCTNRNTFEK
jgi:hypothetical protein